MFRILISSLALLGRRVWVLPIAATCGLVFWTPYWDAHGSAAVLWVALRGAVQGAVILMLRPFEVRGQPYGELRTLLAASLLEVGCFSVAHLGETGIVGAFGGDILAVAARVLLFVIVPSVASMNGFDVRLLVSNLLSSWRLLPKTLPIVLIAVGSVGLLRLALVPLSPDVGIVGHAVALGWIGAFFAALSWSILGIVQNGGPTHREG